MGIKFFISAIKDIAGRKKKVKRMQENCYTRRQQKKIELTQQPLFTMTTDSILKIKEFDSIFNSFDFRVYQSNSDWVENLHNPAYLMIGNRIDSNKAKVIMESLHMKLHTIDVSVFDDESVIQSSGQIYHFDTLPQYPKLVDILLDLSKIVEFIPQSEFVLLVLDILNPHFPIVGILYKNSNFHLVNLVDAINLCEYFSHNPYNTNYQQVLNFEELIQLEKERINL